MLFLLTHPVWDVTMFLFHFCTRLYISTHTSRVGCDVHNGTVAGQVSISTHTSRVGCDLLLSDVLHSARISTHTSRVGCDQEAWDKQATFLNFYSHIPCGM